MVRLTTWLTVGIVILFGYSGILAAGVPQTTDRIVTITQWSRETWTTWVVTKTEILFCRTGDEPVVRFPISSEVAKSIADSADTLSPDLRRQAYSGDGVDGTMLRISFSNDGVLLPDGIECSNVWMPWLGPMVHKICRAMPAKFEISFEKKMLERWKQQQTDLQFLGKPVPDRIEVEVRPLTAVYPSGSLR